MDKICIVTRRLRNAHPSVTTAGNAGVQKDTECDVSTPQILLDTDSSQNTLIQAGQSVTITLSQEQSKTLQSSDCIRQWLNGTTCDPHLNIKKDEEGRIVMNLSIAEINLHMLRSDQVCQMLQISKSFLQRLIHGGSIKSYKIGRLRRFSMHDVLDYLTNHEDFEKDRKQAVKLYGQNHLSIKSVR
ncbi:MAG: helix-turn-helix domain-containing protein [Smithellaceae bacterium]